MRPPLVTVKGLLASGLVVTAAACAGDSPQVVSSNTTATTTSRSRTTTTTTAPTVVTPKGSAASSVPVLATAAGSRHGSQRLLPSDKLADWALLPAGPYQVGATTITLSNQARPLTVEVWFPLDQSVDVSSLIARRYSLLPEVYYDSPTAYSAAPEHVADGAFPLVVYSHGSGGLRYIDSAFTEAVASQGFIVAATDHVGNTATDLLADTAESIAKIMIDRPNDVERVIDALTGVSKLRSLGPIPDHVDGDRVAVVGHSVGGATAISTVTGYSDALGSVEPDPRVKAVVPIAPAVDTVFTPEQLERVNVPMLIVSASEDRSTPVDPNVTRLWDDTNNAPAYWAELIGAEHNSFTDMCAYQSAFADRPEVPDLIRETVDEYALEGCAIHTMDADHAHDLTVSYVVRFLNETLNGGVPITLQSPPNDVVLAVRD